MQRYSGIWWASILLSSVVTGGGSLIVFSLLTDWPMLTVIKASVAMVLVGDIVLALFMERIAPTRVRVGPGERLHRLQLPRDTGRVLADFANGRGRISIRGETWRARQDAGSSSQLEAGAAVRVIAREGLTLVVAATDTR